VFQAWRYGCLADGLHEGAGREKSAPNEDDVEERLKAGIGAEKLIRNGSSIYNQRTGIWFVLPVPAQREPLPMESQARLQNLPGT
jgi:hypothetical protein